MYLSGTPHVAMEMGDTACVTLSCPFASFVEKKGKYRIKGQASQESVQEETMKSILKFLNKRKKTVALQEDHDKWQ